MRRWRRDPSTSSLVPSGTLTLLVVDDEPQIRREVDPIRPRFIQTEPGVGYRFEPDGITPA